MTIFLPKTALSRLAGPQQRELDLGLPHGKVTYVTWAWVRAVERYLSSRIAFDNARNAAMTLRHRRGKIANANGIKVPPANHVAALVSTSWHNEMLTLAEFIIVKHAPELICRRRQFTVISNHGLHNLPLPDCHFYLT